MPNTYVVTGGAGFIGSHIAERLLRDGQRVRVIDNLLTGKQAHLDYLQSLDGDLALAIGSITDIETMRSLCRGADYVIHQAALPSVPRSVADPLETNAHCIDGTLKVLIAARDAGVRRVVYAASSSAYGDQVGERKIETMRPMPISPYALPSWPANYMPQPFITAMVWRRSPCVISTSLDRVKIPTRPTRL